MHFSPCVCSIFPLPCLILGSWLPPFGRVLRWQFCILPNNEVRFLLSKERKAFAVCCPNRRPERIARGDRVWFGLQVPLVSAWSLTVCWTNVHMHSRVCAVRLEEKKEKAYAVSSTLIVVGKQSRATKTRIPIRCWPRALISDGLCTWDQALREPPALTALEERHIPDIATGTTSWVLHRCLYTSESTDKAQRSSIRYSIRSLQPTTTFPWFPSNNMNLTSWWTHFQKYRKASIIAHE